MNNFHTLTDEQKRMVLRNAEENIHLRTLLSLLTSKLS